jgi:LPXTG-motif cell wall-anchored protein
MQGVADAPHFGCWIERRTHIYVCALVYSDLAGARLMSIKTTTILSAACLIACASAASAQTKVDRSFTAVANDCNSITWSEQALATYPTIASACQGVEERNGKKYVKFEGTLKKNVNRGQQLVVHFKDGGEVTLSPPAETNLYVNGKKTPVSDLERGSDLKFYIAEDRLAAQFPETETRTARFVIVPIVLHDRNEQLASLPHTTSPLPLMALSGLLSLGLGGFLSLRRRRR